MKTVIITNIVIGEEPLATLAFPYDERSKQLVRTVPGAEWRANEKVWTVPLTERTLEKLLRLFKRKA